ncbi:unnamed protein product [Durusdinium trenchii]|uniref:Uncharacterized protein n=1 Tax=Durusdinium trenchii TaxID=1381693 RepID=A0ABP0QFR9_9DINO
MAMSNPMAIFETAPALSVLVASFLPPIDLGTWRRTARAAAATSRSVPRPALWVLGGTAPPSLASVEGWDEEAERWEVLTPLPARRYGHCCAILKSDLYLLGGVGGPREAFRWNGQRWIELPTMPVPRVDAAAVSWASYLYVLGGAGNANASNRPLAHCSRWAPQAASWESIPAMSCGRAALAAAAPLGRGVVATGGGPGERRCERFDETAWCWRPAPAMALGRQGHAAVAVEGHLVVLGGRAHGRPSAAVEIWLSNAKAWVPLAPLQLRRCNPAAAVLSGHIYVCGGNDGARSLSAVERLDLTELDAPLSRPVATCRWAWLPSLQVARSAAQAVGPSHGTMDGLEIQLGFATEPSTFAAQNVRKTPNRVRRSTAQTAEPPRRGDGNRAGLVSGLGPSGAVEWCGWTSSRGWMPGLPQSGGEHYHPELAVEDDAEAEEDEDEKGDEEEACLVVFLSIHFALVGHDLQLVCRRLWQWLTTAAELSAEETLKKQRTLEGLQEIRRTSYVVSCRTFVHITAGNCLAHATMLFWSKDPHLIPQVGIMGLVYLHHLTIASGTWQPSIKHIRWFSSTIYLWFLVYILCTPSTLSLNDSLTTMKFIICSRYVMTVVFMDTKVSGVFQSLASLAVIYVEGSVDGRSVVQALQDECQILLSIITISMSLEYFIQKRIEALLETADAESMLSSFRRMLRGLCDGALLLDSGLRVQGSPACLKHLLMTTTNLNGKDFRSFIPEDEQQAFQHFLDASAENHQSSPPDVAPPCLRVSLRGAMNCRTACDIFHVPMPLVGDTSHLLALREDIENTGRGPPDAPETEGPAPLLHGSSLKTPKEFDSDERSKSSSSSVSSHRKSFAGVLPLEDLVIMVAPNTWSVEQFHASLRCEVPNGPRLRSFLRHWDEVEKTLSCFATSDLTSMDTKLSLRLCGHHFTTSANISRFEVPSGKTKFRLHMTRFRSRSQAGRLQEIHE